MKLRASFPFISLLAAVIAFVGWGVVWVPKVKAQQKPAPQNAQAVPARASGDLNERIARLEQRILDMQSVIATLQSFVRDGGAAPAQGGFPPAGGPPAAGGAGGAPSEINIRVLALETQIRALTGQMEQINSKLDQVPAGAGVNSPSPDVGQRLGATPQLGSQQLQASGGGAQFGRPAQPAPAPAPQFGTSTAPPAPGNPFDRAMQGSPQRPPAPQVPPAPRQSAQLPGLTGLSSTGGDGSRGVYDASYQSFLRNDLPAAEKGFSSFVTSYPDDALASNAHYWLGRTYYQRKKFEPAAKAFLAGYKKDKKSAIAPDALLHLGMSLAQLGEKDAACSTLKAIAKQFPDASGTLKQDVASTLKRTRC